jgi:hypothetical protein
MSSRTTLKKFLKDYTAQENMVFLIYYLKLGES